MGLDCDKETIMPLLNIFAYLMVCSLLSVHFLCNTNIVYGWFAYNCNQTCGTFHSRYSCSLLDSGSW